MSEAATDPRKVEVKIFAEDFLAWLDGQDSANQLLRMAIKKLLANGAMHGKESIPITKSSKQLPFNIDAIPWEDRQNEKGPFQLCSDESNADFLALRAFILQHAGGKISTRDTQGMLWYVWAFTDQKTLGRKKSQFISRKR